MSNYPFHQSFFSDLAAFDADTFVDPMESDVEVEELNPFHYEDEEAYQDALYAARMAPYNQDEDDFREPNFDDAYGHEPAWWDHGDPALFRD